MAKEEEAMSGKSFLQVIGGDGDDADDDGDVNGIEAMPGNSIPLLYDICLMCIIAKSMIPSCICMIDIIANV